MLMNVLSCCKKILLWLKGLINCLGMMGCGLLCIMKKENDIFKLKIINHLFYFHVYIIDSKVWNIIWFLNWETQRVFLVVNNSPWLKMMSLLTSWY